MLIFFMLFSSLTIGKAYDDYNWSYYNNDVLENTNEIHQLVISLQEDDNILITIKPNSNLDDGEKNHSNNDPADNFTMVPNVFYPSTKLEKWVNINLKRSFPFIAIGLIGAIGFITEIIMFRKTKHLSINFSYWYLQQILLTNFILLILLPFMALTDGNGNSSLVVVNVKNIIRTLFYLGFFSSLQFHVILSIGQLVSHRWGWKWRLNQAKFIISVTIAVWLIAFAFSLPIFYADSSKPIQVAFLTYMATLFIISFFVTITARSLMRLLIHQVKRTNNAEKENGKFNKTKVNKMNDKINMNKVDHEEIFEVKDRETDQKTKKENGEKDKIARLEYALLKASTGISISFFIAWMAFMIIGLIIKRDNFLLLNYSDYNAVEYAGLIIIYINKVIGIYIYILTMKLNGKRQIWNYDHMIEFKTLV